MVEEAIEELRKFRERHPYYTRLWPFTFLYYPQPHVYLQNNHVRLLTTREYKKLLKSLPEKERRELEKENEEDIYLPPSYLKEIGEEEETFKNSWFYKWMCNKAERTKQYYDLTPTWGGSGSKRR